MFSVTCHLLFFEGPQPLCLTSSLVSLLLPPWLLYATAMAGVWLLGACTERGIRKPAVLCASGGAVCAPCHWPRPLLSARPQACTRLVCSSSPQDLLLKFRGENKFTPRSQ